VAWLPLVAVVIPTAGSLRGEGTGYVKILWNLLIRVVLEPLRSGCTPSHPAQIRSFVVNIAFDAIGTFRVRAPKFRLICPNCGGP
jgi:hypothetical protein